MCILLLTCACNAPPTPAAAFDLFLDQCSYKAYDQENGTEVAWNVVRMDRLSENDKTKIRSEVDILKQLRHGNILNFYSSWVKDSSDPRGEIVFITEMMTSGTLKQ